MDPLAQELSRLEGKKEGLERRHLELLAAARIEMDKAKRVSGPIDVVTWADGSERQQPMRLQAAILGLMAGGILGVLAAFFLEYVDDTVKTPTDIEKDLGMDCLGVIPMWESDRSVFMDPDIHNTPASEAFAQLRNSVRYAAPNSPENLVLIASALQDEGKTAIAVNLAISFNAEGNRVLLINTDLRRGGTSHIRKVLQIGEEEHNQPGLSEFLSEKAALEEIVRPTKVDGLYLIQAGEELKNPAKLLHSNRIREVFSYGEQEFDVVIVDSAAVLPVVDTTLFSGAVRGVLLVVGAEATSVAHVKQAVKRLRHVGSPIVGAVLNRAREYSHGGYYHYYRYSYRGKTGRDSGGKRA
jgi:capsular exopolysaccharide synthesis family protein